MRTLVLASLVGIFAVGCGSSNNDSGASAAPGGSGSASATAAPAKPVEPEVAAIQAGKWKDPADGHEIPLVQTSLSGCFGFKGYSIKIPEGSTAKTMEGARTCHIALSGAKKDEYHFAVFTDEVKVPFMSATRDKVQNVKNKLLDELDAFLYEVEDPKSGKEFNGWFFKKLGPFNVRCNALRWSEKQELTFAFQRAVIELCRTLTHESPTPGGAR
jgi:hypothetical protein